MIDFLFVLSAFLGLKALSPGRLFWMIWERCLKCWLAWIFLYFRFELVWLRSLGVCFKGFSLLPGSTSLRSILVFRKVGTLSPLKQYSLYFWGEVTTILGVSAALPLGKGAWVYLRWKTGIKLKVTVLEASWFLLSFFKKHGHWPV